MKYAIDGMKFAAVVTMGNEKKADVNFEIGKVEIECSTSEFLEAMKGFTEAMKTMAELRKPHVVGTYNMAGEKID